MVIVTRRFVCVMRGALHVPRGDVEVCEKIKRVTSEREYGSEALLEQ